MGLKNFTKSNLLKTSTTKQIKNKMSNIQNILLRAFENNQWDTDYSIQDEVSYIKQLTDDPNEIIIFFDTMYYEHENIRFNKITMELEYFDEEE
jgi:hypothetical protein